jgi:hypothetical protein
MPVDPANEGCKPSRVSVEQGARLTVAGCDAGDLHDATSNHETLQGHDLRHSVERMI